MLISMSQLKEPEKKSLFVFHPAPERRVSYFSNSRMYKSYPEDLDMFVKDEKEREKMKDAIRASDS